jgi:hypothetical protein
LRAGTKESPDYFAPSRPYEGPGYQV